MSSSFRHFLSDEWSVIAECVDRYEGQLPTGLPELRQFVRDIPPDYEGKALLELAVVDLEFRWKSKQPKTIENYLAEYPELKSVPGAIIELIEHEYHLRQVDDASISIDAYRTRFPDIDLTSIAHDDTCPFESDSAVCPAATDEASTPASIGRYSVRELIGSGGFGRVYRCFDPQLHREVAIKVPHASSKAAVVDSEPMLFEGRTAARLTHANIVAVLDVGQLADGRVFVVYELVDGPSLKQRIHDRDFTRQEAILWCEQVAAALHHAHRHDVVHRDVTPGNILIDRQGNARLADFGLARRDDQFVRDDHGKIVGNLAYMSPEQARGDSHWVSAQSDIYSLGVILYELLTQRRPFTGRDVGDVLDQIQRRDPIPPRAIDDTVSRELEAICLTAMMKEPAKRYHSAADMARALRRTTRPRISSSNWLLIAASLLVIIVLSFLSSNTMSLEERLAAIERQGELVAKDYPYYRSSMAQETEVKRRIDELFREVDMTPQQAQHPLLGLIVASPGQRNYTLMHERQQQYRLRDKDRIWIAAKAPVGGYAYLFHYASNGQAQCIWPRPPTKPVKVLSQLIPSGPDYSGMTFEVIDKGGYGKEMLLLAMADEPLTTGEMSEFTRLVWNAPFELEQEGRIRFVPPQHLKIIAERGFELSAPPDQKLLGRRLYEALQTRFQGYRAVIFQHVPATE